MFIVKIGSNKKLALLELQRFLNLNQTHIVELSADFYLLDSKGIKFEKLIKLGSIRKITKVLDLKQSLDIDFLSKFIINQNPKVFGFSDLSDKLDFTAFDIKKYIKQNFNKSINFYKNKNEKDISASVLLHNKKINEYIVFFKHKFLIAKTLWVQNIDEWSFIDRQRPYSDTKKGMLPIKIARILINIAVQEKSVIYDPFCGTGTILMEGLRLGHFVYGSDIDKKALNGAIKNLNWVCENFNINKTYTIFLEDATKIKKQYFSHKIKAVITEPYMGKPKPNINPKNLKNIFTGLYKLYLGFFKNLVNILEKDTIVIFIFPFIKTSNKIYDFSNLIDKLNEFGYTTICEPIFYNRPQAIVKRQIYIFKFKG